MGDMDHKKIGGKKHPWKPMDDIRKKFEKWARNNYSYIDLSKEKTGCYSQGETQVLEACFESQQSEIDELKKQPDLDINVAYAAGQDSLKAEIDDLKIWNEKLKTWHGKALIMKERLENDCKNLIEVNDNQSKIVGELSSRIAEAEGKCAELQGENKKLRELLKLAWRELERMALAPSLTDDIEDILEG